MNLYIPTDRTKARIISLLEEQSIRGMALKYNLKRRFGMSDSTRNNCIRHLLSAGLITKTQAGPGRSALYSVTPKGQAWLQSYLSTQLGTDISGRVVRELPLTIGFGQVELRYSSNSSYLTNVEELNNLLSPDKHLRRMLVYLVNKKLRTLTSDTISINLQLNIKTRIPREIRTIWRVVRRATRIRVRWKKQRDILFKKTFEKAILSDEDKLMLTKVDYFYYCPVGAIEYALIEYNGYVSSEFSNSKDVGSDLLFFAESKWPLLPPDLRERIVALWNEYSAHYRKDHFYNWYVSFMFEHPDPELEDLSNVNEEKERRQIYYKPDYRIATDIGRKFGIQELYIDFLDFSETPPVIQFEKSLTSKVVVDWFSYLHEKTGYWVFRPEERKIHGVGTLIIDNLLREESLLGIYGNLHYFSRKPLKGLDPSLRKSIHIAVRNNDISVLWKNVFAPENLNNLAKEARPAYALTDQEWFDIWTHMREELLGPPPFSVVPHITYIHNEIMSHYVYSLPRINEFPPFFQVLDRLYAAWVNADKPEVTTSNVGALVQRAFEIYEDCPPLELDSKFFPDPVAIHIDKKPTTKEDQREPWRFDGYFDIDNLMIIKEEEAEHIKQRMSWMTKRYNHKIMLKITNKILELINEVDWEFPI